METKTYLHREWNTQVVTKREYKNPTKFSIDGITFIMVRDVINNDFIILFDGVCVHRNDLGSYKKDYWYEFYEKFVRTKQTIETVKRYVNEIKEQLKNQK